MSPPKTQHTVESRYRKQREHRYAAVVGILLDKRAVGIEVQCKDSRCGRMSFWWAMLDGQVAVNSLLAPFITKQ